MNRTRYLISLLGLCTALVAPMHGQVTRAAFNTATDALLEDDGPAEEITPEAIGTLIKSLAASSHLALTDGTVVVTSGSYADPTWLTGLAWSKIGTTPTTLSGYGITDAQGLDTDLTTWASLTPSANAQSLVTAANYAAMRALLDLEVGTDFYSIAAADAAFDAAGSAATAQSAVQADVDQNETDADAAIAAVQADVDQNETDADAAIAAVQNDVDQNESDADTAIAAVQNDVDQNETDADNAIALKQNADADLTDLAEDGSLSGSKVGPGINAANITTGALPPDRAGTGSGLQILRRNAANTALEFATVNAVGGGDLNVEDIDTFAELSGIVADGTFTNSDAPVVFTDATLSTNTTTGAFRVAGGFGIEGNINAGGNISGVDGTFSGDVTAPNLASQFAARAPRSGIVASSKSIEIGEALATMGPGPRFIRGRFVCPTANAEVTAATILKVGNFILSYDSSGRLRVRSTIGDGIIYLVSGFRADFSGTVVDAVVVSDGADRPILYLNGVAVAGESDIGAGSWSDIEDETTTSFTLGSPSISFVGTILSAEYGNVSLTADEVLALHRFGWAALPQYVHADGGQTIYTSDFSVGVDSWINAANTALLAGNIDGIGGRDDNLRVSHSSAGASGFAIQSVNLLSSMTGKQLRLVGSIYKTAALTGVTSFQIKDNSGNLLATLPTATDDTWVDFDVSLVGSTGPHLRVDVVGSSIPTSQYFYLRALVLTAVGVAGSWDFSTGVGLKQQDESGAGNTMTLSATGVQRLRANDIQTIKSPNGTVYKLEVANDGTLSATAL